MLSELPYDDDLVLISETIKERETHQYLNFGSIPNK